MKKYVIAIVIAFSALFGLSVQAAPLASNTTAVQTEVAQQSAAQKVYWVHRGYGWHRRGWYGGWRGYGWRRPYWRGYGWRGYGWRPRVYGAWGGYGWRRPYWRGYGWRGYGWRGYGWRGHRVYRRW